MGVLNLEWFVQSQNLCRGDTSSSDHNEEPQEPQIWGKFIIIKYVQFRFRRDQNHRTAGVGAPLGLG